VRLAVLALAAGCVDGIDPEWQLDHDRVVAVRATPPHITAGQTALLDALVAHKGGPTSTETPMLATAADAPGDLFTAVHFDVDHWQIDGVDDSRLVPVRAQLGLPAGAPVPLDVIMQFASSSPEQPLIAKKTVWLGDTGANPTSIGNVTIAGQPQTDASAITIASGVDVPITTDVDPADTVGWLTSCGTMHDDNEQAAFIHVEAKDRKSGELALVVRDALGGVIWQVWPISAP
jgi:hypothetical protein